MNKPRYAQCAGCGRLFKPKSSNPSHCPTCIRHSQARAYMEEAARIFREERKAREAEALGRGLRVIEGGRHA